jgi:hypothetical protein
LQTNKPRLIAIDSSDRTGVEALRGAISAQAAKLPQMGQQWSPRWTAAREAVLALAGREPQTTFERFAELCEGQKLAVDEIGTLAKLMHDLGLIIYYDGDEGLRGSSFSTPSGSPRRSATFLTTRRPRMPAASSITSGLRRSGRTGAATRRGTTRTSCGSWRSSMSPTGLKTTIRTA